MRILREGLDMDGFFASVRRSKLSALMLDYDGTLAPFVVDRDKAYPYPGVPERVDAIIRGGGTRLVVVSGRAASDIPKLLCTQEPPEIWGSHGWERIMPDGSSAEVSLGEPESQAVRDAVEWATGLGHAERLELKPAGAAFHVRGLGPSESGSLLAEAETFLKGLAGRTAFEIHGFDGGLEMRLAGRDKGDAVRTLYGELPVGTPAAYLGDDLTDEDAFGAMPDGGLGVLVRPEPRETRADVWLAPPDELLWFLDRWHDAAVGG